jgi:hypothetical protein
MFSKILKDRVFADSIFAAALFIMVFVYGLNTTMFEPPQSVHIWRQTNSTSMALNYYQDSVPFYEPAVHNQWCDGGYSGKTAGEFPIVYYVVAKIWKITGYNIFIFRLVQILILFTGLYLLFRSSQFFFDNRFWAGFVSLLIFTSPMVVFYGPNFLPDVPALSFVFIAWFFISKFLVNRNQSSIWFSALFFSLSMLLKITSGLSFIAFGGWILFELIFQKEKERIFNFKLAQIIPFILVVPVVGAWYWYVEYYNGLHGGQVSYHGIWPVWEMTKEQYLRIIDALNKIYFKELFLPYTQYLTLAVWVYLLVTMKKLPPVLRYFIIVLPIGMLVELLLWFQVLEGHDYYTINLLVVFVAVWAVFFYSLKQTKLITHPVFYVIGLGFLIFNLVTCQTRIETRYTGWMNSMYVDRMKALTEIEPYFNKLGIARDMKVISIPDYTINASLFYMNRKGYTEFASDFSKPETFYSRIEQGAKYLIVNDTTILHKPELQPFINKKVGEFKNISVYDLDGIQAPQ